MVRKLDVAFARFPFGNQEAPSVTNWMVETVFKAKTDPRIAQVSHREFDDTPITMTRNASMKWATEIGADILVMIDSDMAPDLGLRQNTRIPDAVPTWDAAMKFMSDHEGPCCMGVPYCGPPPWENCYVFQPARRQNDHPNIDMTVEQFTREEAARRGGIEKVVALPTGLYFVDMRVVKAGLQHPYFDYEWTDVTRSQKASTEDVYFSRNLALVGVPQYVLWDSWAGHWKRKLVTKPALLSMDSVIETYREAIVRGHSMKERLVMLNEGRLPDEPTEAIPPLSETSQPKEASNASPASETVLGRVRNRRRGAGVASG